MSENTAECEPFPIISIDSLRVFENKLLTTSIFRQLRLQKYSQANDYHLMKIDVIKSNNSKECKITYGFEDGPKFQK